VLGPVVVADPDLLRFQLALQYRYRSDFEKTWREFMRASHVVGYTSVPEAVNKLAKLTGNQSPLLSLLCVVSENTTVDAKPLSDLFQPPQLVVPSGCHDHLIGPSNAAYMDSLSKLYRSLQELASNPSNDALRNEALTNALSADALVRQMARNFRVDKGGVVNSATQTLLEDPIKHVQSLIAGASHQDSSPVSLAK
jgi:type VI protein secretion system component VasK